MIPKSSVILLFSFCSVLFFPSFPLGGEGQVTQKLLLVFFFFCIVGIFSNNQLKICTEIQLVCLLHF